jgi:hypothetical protein
MDRNTQIRKSKIDFFASKKEAILKS